MASPHAFYNDDTDNLVQGVTESFQTGLGLDGHLETPPKSSYSSPKMPITRTVAIIKHHALQHRFDIERRIQEASFEIVKERQMEFDTETDPETLEELFGVEDAHSLAEGPVWVYVLERRRAVEVWHTLMGPGDPDLARHEAPNSLRALYGISDTQNGLMGAFDDPTAELQIAALFASSPPFPTTELPPEGADDGRFGSIRSATSSILDALQQQGLTDEGYAHSNGYAPSNATNPSTVNGSHTRLNANGNAVFRARPIPSTLSKPDIVPRMTKSAALRAGITLDKADGAPRKPITKERQAQTFANVPGHKRSQTIAVASTAAPSIAPRMTKAASLRLGQPIAAPAPIKRSATTDGTDRRKSTFEGVPGHKRRETISVASSRPPSLAPRLNKSSALRVSKEQGPTSFKGPSIGARPSLSRPSSSASLSSPPKTAPVRSRPASQASVKPPPQAAPAPRPSVAPPRRASSVAGIRPRPSSVAGTNTKPAGASDGPAAPSKPRPRPSSVGLPTIAPRTNRSAALRAAKMEAEAAATAAAAAKKNRLSKVPPSSFRSVAV